MHREITVIPCDFRADAFGRNRLIWLAHSALKMGHFTYKCSRPIALDNPADLDTLGQCSHLERRVWSPAMTATMVKVWADSLPQSPPPLIVCPNPLH